MSFASVLPRALAAFAALCFALGGALAQTAQEAEDEDDSPAAASGIAQKPPAKLPAHELTKQLLYEFLLGEIATQRGSEGLAAQTYVDLAKRTRDPRVARRAVEMAKAARMPQQALEAASVWNETDPESPFAQQEMAILLISQKRVDEAEPFLAKLLGANATAAPNMFMQLARLLAINPDAQANLRVARRLAAQHDALAQAHFAVAQSAQAANDEALALAEIRRAAALRPDWDVAALYEAQL